MAHAYLFGILLHLLPERSLEGLHAGEQLLHAAVFLNEACGCLFAHARASRYIVGGISHEGQYVHHLRGVLQAPFGIHLSRPHQYGFVLPRSRFEHVYAVCHQLSVILVGRHHHGVYSPFVGLACQCAYHIIGLEALYLQQGDTVGLQYLFDVRDSQADSLWSLLSLSLVLRISFMAKGAARRVEGNTQMGRLLFLNHFFQSIRKAKDGRCVLSARVDAGVLDERIIGSVNERICIQKV